MKLTYLLILLLLAALPRIAHAEQLKMLQCENCSTVSTLKNTAKARGPGYWSVFSIKNKVIMSFGVEYEPSIGRNITFHINTPVPVENAFALMLEADEIRPHIFTSGQQTIYGSIDVLGGGPHNPVTVSLNGEHDSAYGSFIHYARSCLSSPSCASEFDPAVGKVAGANNLLNGFGINIYSGGGNISWENLPPGFQLWLCDENDDCALMEYDKDKNQWEYKETRAERGLGKRYPKYEDEELNYVFGNSGEAGIFQRGLTGGGAAVTGVWKLKTVLACVTANGIKICHYETVSY